MAGVTMSGVSQTVPDSRRGHAQTKPLQVRNAFNAPRDPRGRGAAAVQHPAGVSGRALLAQGMIKHSTFEYDF